MIRPYHTKNPERGQALIVIAISLIVLAGIVGLVVDGGNAFLDRRRAQNAADSAALAAALARVRGQNPTTAALTSAAKNGFTNDGTNNTVKIHIPPASGIHKDDAQYIEVEIVSHVRTYVAYIFGWRQFTNDVQAVSRSKPSEVRQILGGAALVSLTNKSDCGSDKGFWLHGNASLDVSGGSVFVNSTNPNCAFIQQGSSSLHVENPNSIQVVGGVSIEKPQLLSPSVVVGASGIGYPPPFFMPDINCGDTKAAISDDGISMSPGNWNDTFPPKGVTQLASGVYCLTDGFEVSGNQTLTGHGVTIVVQKGDVRFEGNANLVLDASDSGDYRGLLIFLPKTNDSQVTLNGDAASSFTGTILAPASQIVIAGNNSSDGFHSQIIGRSIEVNSSGKVAIVYSSQENYDVITMPEVQLSQ